MGCLKTRTSHVTKKLPKPNLTVVHSVVLTGLQEAELIEYVNWSDGDMGLRSALGQMVAKMSNGTYGVRIVNDPEESLIANLDRAKRHRIIHRAMRSIGKRARALTQSYVLCPRPAYVTGVFGRWHTGIVLSIADDVGEVVEACRKIAVEGKGKHPDAHKMLEGLRRVATGLYNDACVAYVEALKKAREPLVAPSVYRGKRLETMPHECRVSEVYPCECGGGRVR